MPSVKTPPCSAPSRFTVLKFVSPLPAAQHRNRERLAFQKLVSGVRFEEGADRDVWSTATRSASRGRQVLPAVDHHGRDEDLPRGGGEVRDHPQHLSKRVRRGEVLEPFRVAGVNEFDGPQLNLVAAPVQYLGHRVDDSLGLLGVDEVGEQDCRPSRRCHGDVPARLRSPRTQGDIQLSAPPATAKPSRPLTRACRDVGPTGVPRCTPLKPASASLFAAAVGSQGVDGERPEADVSQ